MSRPLLWLITKQCVAGSDMCFFCGRMAWLLHRPSRVPGCTRVEREFGRIWLDSWWCDTKKPTVGGRYKMIDEEIEFEGLMYEGLASSVAGFDRHLAGRLSILVDDGDGGDGGKVRNQAALLVPVAKPAAISCTTCTGSRGHELCSISIPTQ
jgi:hypothetical protein